MHSFSLTDPNVRFHRVDYDLFDRRAMVSNHIPVPETKRFYYNGNQIYREDDRDFAEKSVFINGIGRDTPAIRIDDSFPAEVYHRDGLSSVVATTNAETGVESGTQGFDPWGNPVPSLTTGLPIERYGYAGAQPDKTGLVYMRARHYQPQVGRFIQRDPAGYVEGVNLYAHVRNQPVNRIDPSGRSSILTTFGEQGVSYYEPASTSQGGLFSAPDNAIDAVSQGAALLGGAGQIGAGIALCSALAGCVGGAPLIALGVNNIQEGLSGQDGIFRNLTKSGASQLGFSERTGSIAFSVLDAGTSIAALTRKVPKLGRVVLDSGFRTKPIRLFRSIPSDFEPAFRQLTQFAIFRELALTAIGVGGSFQDSGPSE